MIRRVVGLGTRKH